MSEAGDLLDRWRLYREALPILPNATTANTLFTVLDHYNVGEGHAWPTQERIAGIINASVRSVERAIQWLHDHDVIRVETRRNETGQKRNRYFPNFDFTIDKTETQPSQMSVGQPSPVSNPTVTDVGLTTLKNKPNLKQTYLGPDAPNAPGIHPVKKLESTKPKRPNKTNKRRLAGALRKFAAELVYLGPPLDEALVESMAQVFGKRFDLDEISLDAWVVWFDHQPQDIQERLLNAHQEALDNDTGKHLDVFREFLDVEISFEGAGQFEPRKPQQSEILLPINGGKMGATNKGWPSGVSVAAPEELLGLQRAGLSVGEVASSLAVSPGKVQSWFEGDVEPSADDITRLARMCIQVGAPAMEAVA